MKKDEIPHDTDRVFASVTKVVYAVNEKGRLESAKTVGWEVEATVLEQAVQDIHRQASEALMRVRAGTSSPLEYHMYAQRMDPPMLAQAVGCLRWTLRRHLKPAGFAKLTTARLERYADVLGIDVDRLREVPAGEHE